MTVPPIALTCSGGRVHLVAPDHGTISIFDIAEHLARLCRYSGATNIPFSVAQHSLVVAAAMHEAHGALAAVYGLLHDAHEAYIGDITEPTTTAIEFYFGGIRGVLDAIRLDLDQAIHRALHLDWPPPADIQNLLAHAHARVVATELRDVMMDCHNEVAALRRAFVYPLSRRIIPFRNYAAAAENYLTYLRRYTALAGLTAPI